MMLQHPIYPLVIATMTLFIVVIQSIQTEKVLKFSMGLAFLDIAISIFSLMIFNNTIKDHEIYQWIYRRQGERTLFYGNGTCAICHL